MFSVPDEPRILNWPDCYNVRDLGGLPCSDGGRTRWRAVVRSDKPARLTAVGRQALLAYGIRTIIDLRHPVEVAAQPTPFGRNYPTTPTVTVLALSAERADPAIRKAMNATGTRAGAYCVALDRMADEQAAIVQAVADAQSGGVLVHCSAGKDRTGIVVALLLQLAGVEDEAIVADFALSQACLWPFYEQLVAKAGGEDRLDPWQKPLTEPETMRQVLDHLHTTYGGARGYLQRAGLTPQTIDRVRARLRDPDNGGC